MLKGKTVAIGVTGSIAAYKMANVASMLIKQHADVHVLMTENATKFINPITFETLTNHKCLVETFDRNFQFHVAHVSLGQKADVMLIAPASANVIGKLANGIADDMLTTTAMAATCPKIIAPAMNTHMFLNPIVQDNLKKLEHYGYEVISPAAGRLACGDVGAGKLPDEETLVNYIYRTIAKEKDMKGKKVLVTAGPTRESLDPVRFLSNRSTGKMGYAVAKMAMLRGADVTLVSGPVNIPAPPFVNVVHVESAQQMFEAVKDAVADQDIIIKSAAVADYRPMTVAEDKIKKTEGDMSIPLERTTDIIKYLGEHKKEGQFICGFSMETKDMLENSSAKLVKKNMDMIVANNVKDEGAGFAVDTNKVVMITKDGMKDLPLMSKEEVADNLLTEIMERING
ncbi:MAG: bifunctional phosphopantothenoylcysteine decarboxylase/phosphopantothenate--cysteine ligase CoaBC [Lachnospiraceae bacterium]|nr:bifunctional phosphopantothenoylcysteine decarboxylase/phosphopantothenate--cysteine ligase CoaBC [Lachnospiraceae bacterium]